MIFHGRRLFEARQSRGLSRKALAAALGVPVTKIRRWERGEATPRVSVIAGLDEYGGIIRALGFPGSFYRMPPAPSLGHTSMDYHLTAYECDGCDEAIEGYLVENRDAAEHYHPGCEPRPPGGAR